MRFNKSANRNEYILLQPAEIEVIAMDKGSLCLLYSGSGHVHLLYTKLEPEQASEKLMEAMAEPYCDLSQNGFRHYDTVWKDWTFHGPSSISDSAWAQIQRHIDAWHKE